MPNAFNAFLPACVAGGCLLVSYLYRRGAGWHRWARVTLVLTHGT